MSRVELDAVDRATVESVRRRLRALDEQGVGDLDQGGLISLSGRLMALVDALLAVIDGASRDKGSARCPAAHPDDPTACDGPRDAVLIRDRQMSRASDTMTEAVPGCEHHAARMLASIDGGQVHPGTVDGAAVRVRAAADVIRPFVWYGDAPRTGPDQLSHAENRAPGDGGAGEGRG